MTVPTNRNKKPTQDPEIAAIISSDEPIVEEPKIEDDPANQEPKVEDVDTGEPKETPVEPIVEPPISEETPKKPVVEVKQPEIDYKEKFKESSKEALTLHFKNQKITETIDEAANLPEPTEDEVREYAKEQGEEYEDLTDLTKAIMKDTLLNKRRFEKINEANKESKDINAWVGKVDHFLETPETITKYPDLMDNAEDFRSFALKQSRRGTDLEDLATSFLYGLSQSPVKKNKGSLLMTTGGGGVEPKPAGIDEEQAKVIRVNNPKEYRRLIKQGKIKIEI